MVESFDPARGEMVFDAFPGVIEEMSILTLHTMLAMKCHEVSSLPTGASVG